MVIYIETKWSPRMLVIIGAWRNAEVAGRNSKQRNVGWYSIKTHASKDRVSLKILVSIDLDVITRSKQNFKHRKPG